MPWKDCLRRASELGATLCSDDYTQSKGWGTHRVGSTADAAERFYTVLLKPITESHDCVVGRHDRVSLMDRSSLSTKAEYDGDTWWYHDAGTMYYDECLYLASSAGASIIDPSTIGQGDGDGYWMYTRHSGNVYMYWTGADTQGMYNVGCQDRGGSQKCMIG